MWLGKGSHAQNAFSAEQTLHCAANLDSLVQESGTTRLSEGFKRPLGAAPRSGPDFPVEKESRRLAHGLKEIGIEHQLQLSLTRWGRTRRRSQLLEVQSEVNSVVIALTRLRLLSLNCGRLDHRMSHTFFVSHFISWSLISLRGFIM